MEPGAEVVLAGVPDLVDIRQRVARGRRLVITLGETVTMPAATAAARALRVGLPPDVHVFASQSSAAHGPTLMVLQLVSEAEAATVRPDLGILVSEFRRVAGALVDQMWANASPVSGIDEDCPEPSDVATQPGIWIRMGSTAGSKIQSAAGSSKPTSTLQTASIRTFCCCTRRPPAATVRSSMPARRASTTCAANSS